MDKAKLIAESTIKVADWRSVSKASLDMSVFPATKFKVVPWWFWFMSWAFSTYYSTDGTFCIEAKCFRGYIFITKCYRSEDYKCHKKP